MFLMATNIDLGIGLDTQGNIIINEDQIQYRLLEAESDEWRSHIRLRTIAVVLRDNKGVAKSLVKKRYCPNDCQNTRCPLEEFILEKAKWRM
jgi:hypothetical protein